MQKNDFLDSLVQSGDIESYSFHTFETCPGSGSREMDSVVLILLSGKKIEISAICSGAAENGNLIVEDGSTNRYAG